MVTGPDRDSIKRFICIHGHFYQPPRENPFLGVIERQVSAHPYHDWNERVNAESYAPSSAAQILNSSGQTQCMVNNYARMSFNFGPTLLAWMQEADPETYHSILQADTLSQSLFNGHGSAMAQCYNHMIMPLANERDQLTQVEWGVRDFQSRFSRDPEGMWLPETAVNTSSLEALARYGLRYTVLAPHQARSLVGHEGDVDTTQPYLCHLPSGRTITLFFYHGALSQAVAFQKLAASGERFVETLLSGFTAAPQGPQLIHIATDGETYGHHHPYGEMGLAYAVEKLRTSEEARLINYSAYLALHPPTQEIGIREDSSWSCYHGVERWRSDCGCNSGMQKEGWNQKWRAPLREALNLLRDHLDQVFTKTLQTLLHDPWQARQAYWDIFAENPQREGSDRHPEQEPNRRHKFLKTHAKPDLQAHEEAQIWSLLEMQKYRQLMFTSCGWFFDDVSGIETQQCLEYALFAIDLTKCVVNFEPPHLFWDLLKQAQSNLKPQVNAFTLTDHVRHTSVVTSDQVMAHATAVWALQKKWPHQIIAHHRIQVVEERKVEEIGFCWQTARVQSQSQLTQQTEVWTVGTLQVGLDLASEQTPQPMIGVVRTNGETAIPTALENRPASQLITVFKKLFPNAGLAQAGLFRDARYENVKHDLHHDLQVLISSFGPEPFVASPHIEISPDHQLVQSAGALLHQHDFLHALKHMDLAQLEALVQNPNNVRVDWPLLRLEIERTLSHKIRLGLLQKDEALLETCAQIKNWADRHDLHVSLWPMQRVLWSWIQEDRTRAELAFIRKLAGHVRLHLEH